MKCPSARTWAEAIVVSRPSVWTISRAPAGLLRVTQLNPSGHDPRIRMSARVSKTTGCPAIQLLSGASCRLARTSTPMPSASPAPTTTGNHASPDMRLNVLTLPSYYKARLSLNTQKRPHNDGVSGPDSRARIGVLQRTRGVTPEESVTLCDGHGALVGAGPRADRCRAAAFRTSKCRHPAGHRVPCTADRREIVPRQAPPTGRPFSIGDCHRLDLDAKAEQEGSGQVSPPRTQRRSQRSLALREFALGIEALERFTAGEPLYRVHECVFGVLALESEPVDPRL